MYLSKHSAALMSSLSYGRSDWVDQMSLNAKPRPLSWTSNHREKLQQGLNRGEKILQILFPVPVN